MKKVFLFLSLSLLFFISKAQIQVPGEPFQWQKKSIDLSQVNFEAKPKLDLQSLRAEDEVVDQYKENPYRFAYDWEVDFNVLSENNLTILKNGDKLYRLGIHCSSATSINMIFGDYYIPEGGEVYIWNESRTDFLGALTHYNNKEYGSLAVGLVHSDKIIIEYRQPVAVTEQASLQISQISHGYRPVINKWAMDKGPLGTSGSCNMNVNCPDAADWQQEKRGVALILNGGSVWCTGSLINTTNEDGTPYFLTAAHCDGNESNWVFVFNHEYSGCSNSGSAPTNQTVSGAVEQASTNASDAHLILLSSDVPLSYNPYYNGWDNSGDIAPLAVGIHHPSGDVKKISFDDDPLTNTQYGGSTPGNFTHWRIEAWERGTTTEGGSSGSPLFDDNHRIIGQLHGGTASCGNSIDDYYGAFHVSWSTLDSFLDPNNSGVETVNGYDPNNTFVVDVVATGIQNLPSVNCEPEAFVPSFEFSNSGSQTLTSATISYSYNGINQTNIPWSGSLNQGQSTTVSLAQMTPEAGVNTIAATVTVSGDENASNNSSSDNFTGSSSVGSGLNEININIVPDDYGSETTWELKDPNGVTVSSGGPYTNNDSTPINETYIIAQGNEGCYEFIINDSYGDGICCSFGLGSYILTDSEGATLIAGGEFLFQESGMISMSRGGIEMNLTAYLQGPFNEDDGLMTDFLRQDGEIPLDEPFTALSFNHVGSGGGETTTQGTLDETGSDAVVDWLFVELRDGNNSSTILATKSVLLTRNGGIIDSEGNSSITFDGVDASSVYVVLRHRNHFGIRTANSYSTDALITVDFSSPSTPIFGTDATVNVAGKELMLAGDANRDGQINPVDKNDHWRVENGQSVDYLNGKADFNLDGAVNPVDKNAYWRINNSKVEQLD